MLILTFMIHWQKLSEPDCLGYELVALPFVSWLFLFIIVISLFSCIPEIAHWLSAGRLLPNTQINTTQTQQTQVILSHTNHVTAGFINRSCRLTAEWHTTRREPEPAHIHLKKHSKCKRADTSFLVFGPFQTHTLPRLQNQWFPQTFKQERDTFVLNGG